MSRKAHSSLPLLDFKIVNVVSSTKTNCKIDIEALSRKFFHTQYQPGIFPGLVYRRERPKATIIMFSTGKIVSIGTSAEEDARRSILATVSEIESEEGMEIKVERIKTENVVAVANIGGEVDLEKFVEFGSSVIYEPEIFPGAIYRVKKNVTILVFKNGKLVLAGSKSKKEAVLMMESAIRTLQKSGCLGRVPQN